MKIVFFLYTDNPEKDGEYIEIETTLDELGFIPVVGDSVCFAKEVRRQGDSEDIDDYYEIEFFVDERRLHDFETVYLHCK